MLDYLAQTSGLKVLLLRLLEILTGYGETPQTSDF